jgi:hypothetical protein
MGALELRRHLALAMLMTDKRFCLWEMMVQNKTKPWHLVLPAQGDFYAYQFIY